MSKEYLLALAKEYAESMLHYVPSKQHPIDKLSGMQADVLGHAKLMLEKIPEKVKNNNAAEALQDLGFVQGVFWVLRTFNLEDIHNHNHGYDDHEGHDHEHDETGGTEGTTT